MASSSRYSRSGWRTAALFWARPVESRMVLGWRRVGTADGSGTDSLGRLHPGGSSIHGGLSNRKRPLWLVHVRDARPDAQNGDRTPQGIGHFERVLVRPDFEVPLLLRIFARGQGGLRVFPGRSRARRIGRGGPFPVLRASVRSGSGTSPRCPAADRAD